MLASLFVYAGLILALSGAIMAVRSWRRGAPVLGIALALVITGFLLPAREQKVTDPLTQLDHFAPTWQFSEHHQISIAARPERVFEAIQRVTAGEIFLFRTLTTIRRLGRPLPESILNAPENKPLIDIATGSGFLRLAMDPPRELVIGTIVMAPREYRGYQGNLTPEIYRTLRKPGFALVTMNFLVQPDTNGGSVVSTETRVFATSVAARRRFASYWRLIYPGSALIRRMWLRAIKKRAEVTETPTY